jgi:hypothetical protein
MPVLPLPEPLAAQIAERATRNAREGLVRRGWSPRNQSALHPVAEEGLVGIRTSVQYLMYQNRGIRPFLMTALEGKTVPIKGRLFRVRGVGMPGMGFQDRKYNPVKGPVWRQQRWRHPGIRPERFLENAISQSLLEFGPQLQGRIVRAIAEGEEL